MENKYNCIDIVKAYWNQAYLSYFDALKMAYKIQ